MPPPAERVDDFLAASSEVDAVLLSLGRGSGSEDIPAALDELMAELGDDLPVLVVIPPAGLYSAATSESVLAWAEERDDRVSLVNLRESAPENPTAEEWALTFQAELP